VSVQLVTFCGIKGIMLEIYYFYKNVAYEIQVNVNNGSSQKVIYLSESMGIFPMSVYFESSKKVELKHNFPFMLLFVFVRSFISNLTDKPIKSFQ